MFAVMLTVLLSVSVVSDGQSVFVSNDGSESVSYSIQIGDGHAVHELSPGESRLWTGDMPHWAVWQGSELVAYGVFTDSTESPAHVAKVIEKVAKRGETVAPDVRVFDGPYQIV